MPLNDTVRAIERHAQLGFADDISCTSLRVVGKAAAAPPIPLQVNADLDAKLANGPCSWLPAGGVSPSISRLTGGNLYLTRPYLDREPDDFLIAALTMTYDWHRRGVTPPLTGFQPLDGCGSRTHASITYHRQQEREGSEQ